MIIFMPKEFFYKWYCVCGKSVNAGENMYAVGNIGVAADSNKKMAAALNADGTVYAKNALTDGNIYANSGMSMHHMYGHQEILTLTIFIQMEILMLMEDKCR
jgi:hypothetical protein